MHALHISFSYIFFTDSILMTCLQISFSDVFLCILMMYIQILWFSSIYFTDNIFLYLELCDIFSCTLSPPNLTFTCTESTKKVPAQFLLHCFVCLSALNRSCPNQNSPCLEDEKRSLYQYLKMFWHSISRGL